MKYFNTIAFKNVDCSKLTSQLRMRIKFFHFVKCFYEVKLFIIVVKNLLLNRIFNCT